MPKSPKSSIKYAVMSWAVTIIITACAGPKADILLITVYVISAPKTPPRSIYLLSIEKIAEKYNNSEIVLDAEDFVGVNFSVKRERRTKDGK